MNTPMPPNEREPLDRDERELAELYRRLPEARPGPELDARVLAEAERAAVAAQKRHRPRQWLLGFGSAAALVLAAGLVWQQHRSSRPHAGTAASQQRASAPAATATHVSGEHGTLIPVRVHDNAEATNVAPRMARPDRLETARMAVPRDRPAAAELRAVPQKPSVGGFIPPNANHPSTADAAASTGGRAIPLAAPPPPPRMAEPVAPNAKTRLKIPDRVAEQAAPASPASTPPLPELVRQARTALKRHDRMSARRLVLQIRTAYPDARMPGDLAALLPAHAASTGTP